MRRKPLVRAQLKSGPTLDGVLVRRTRDFYVLSAVKSVEDEETTVSLPGEVLIPRANVHYFQAL